MIRTLLTTMTVASLAACGTQPVASAPAPAPTVGIANPASVYCASLGGKGEIRKTADGAAYSMCHLPDGTVIEEWSLFRRDHPAQ